MKILITGGCGYIGRNLIHIIKNNYPNLHIDSLDIDPIATICKDIRLPFQLPHYDCVVHLAALAKVGESVKNPWDYYNTNIVGTKNVLNLSFDNFIFASSGSVEGLMSPYAISKKVCEDVIIKECPSYTIFRFYNVIGGKFPQKNTEAIFISLKKAVETGIFYINGDDYNTPDGTVVRDYVHVNDVCDSIISAIFKPLCSIEGLGTGEGYSVKHIAEMFRRVNDVNFDIRYLPRRTGDMPINFIKNPSHYFKSTRSLESMLKL